MEFSEPGPEDAEVVRDTSLAALQASYALSPETIRALLEEEFGEDALAGKVDDESVVIVAAYEGEELAGFAEGALVDGAGEIRWLFVHPDWRGRGVGTELFKRMRGELESQGAETVRALVLSDNMEGNQFFERFDMGVAGDDTIEIDEEVHPVEVYEPGAEGDERESQELEEIPETVQTDDGELPVDQEETRPGTKGPFLIAYAERGSDEVAGYYCTASDTLVPTIDDLGRIECEECGNVHRADDWDSSYL